MQQPIDKNQKRPHNKTSIFSGSRFTIRTAGVFFLVSAVIEGLSVSSTVLLFGNVHSGIVAVVYHLLYVGLFLGIGVGLWAAKSWGYRFAFIGTVLYTLDRILYLLYSPAEAMSVLGEYGVLLGPEGQRLITQVMDIVTVLTLICWWGFLYYLYRKRDYFKSSGK